MRRIALLSWLVTMAMGGCKAQVGDICRCAADCQDGLLCASGPTVLDPDACFSGDKTGECVEDDNLPSETGGPSTPNPLDDLPSKRDLGGDETSDTGTTGDTTDTDTTDTGTTDTGTTDTGTTDTTDTGTTDTGTTDTGTTDTGTTDTGTSSSTT